MKSGETSLIAYPPNWRRMKPWRRMLYRLWFYHVPKLFRLKGLEA